ncbi:hypothetical protein A2U01_0118152, partial [Trifolium medium]|nr:hypothetical protein [Trifolium medium]
SPETDAAVQEETPTETTKVTEMLRRLDTVFTKYLRML